MLCWPPPSRIGEACTTRPKKASICGSPLRTGATLDAKLASLSATGAECGGAPYSPEVRLRPCVKGLPLSCRRAGRFPPACVWMGVSRLKRHSLFVCLSVLVNQHDPDLQRMSLTAPAIRVFLFYSFVVMADTLLEIENEISHDHTFVHIELARVLYFAQMLQRRN